MAWTYNNVRIYVTAIDESLQQIIARLQPLSSTTVLQIFGDEATTYKLDFLVVGNSNRDLLKAMINDGTAYALVGNDFTSTNLYLSKLAIKRSKTLFQTIDTLQACETPVYECSMELML